MHAPDTKPAWKLSYAFDLPYYADFVIDADTEAEAERIAQALLDAGTLPEIMDGHAQACWDNACNERVFTSGPDDEDEETDRLPYYAKLNQIKLPEDWQTPPAAAPAPAMDPDKRLARIAQLLTALEMAVPAVEYYHEHEGAPETLATVRAALTEGGAL